MQNTTPRYMIEILNLYSVFLYSRTRTFAYHLWELVSRNSIPIYIYGNVQNITELPGLKGNWGFQFGEKGYHIAIRMERVLCGRAGGTIR